MNFYPIYKSKLEPWIKWWILKGNKIAPKILSEVIEGTTPITIEGVYKGTSLQELLFKGQTIQEGTPSPEAPIPVQVVKEDNYININEDSYRVDLGGKNKFNVEQAITRMENAGGALINGWGTYEDGILTMNRSMGYHGVCYFAGQKFNLKANKTYTLSATVYLTGTNTTSNVILGFEGASNPNVTITKETWTKVSKTVSFTEDKENVRVFIQPSNTGNVLQIKEILLCEGTDTTYSPYTANPIELNKIGNYQDKLYYDSDKWYIEKKVNKVIFNGSENWTQTNRPDGNVFWNYYDLLNVPKPYLNSSVIKICNYFPYEFKTWGDVSVNCMGENGLFNVNRPSFLFRISTNILSTLEEWKTWLSTHNIIVCYILAEATTTEITNTNLIEQLETIKNATLISGTNEITQTPSDLPFILNFKYYMKG